MQCESGVWRRKRRSHMSFLTETMGVQSHRCVNVASEIVYIIYKYININKNANINIHTYRRLLRERACASA